MELEGFPRAWMTRKTRRGHVVAFAGCDGIISPPSSHPKCRLLCTSCSASAFQVHLTIGCILFKSHFPSILHTLLSPSAERQKSTPLVCAIILECAIVTQLEWKCSQLHGLQFGHQQNLRNAGVSVKFGILKCSWQRQISNTLIHVDAAYLSVKWVCYAAQM